MKLVNAFLSALILLPSIAIADSSDDTLKFYLSKSDLVIKGKIKTEPIGEIHELGVPNYICEFGVANVIKGDGKLKDKTIKVDIKRYEMDKKDRHPLIKKDAECILFLKKRPEGNIPQWATADFWFGIQHPSPWMVKSLKRVVKEETVTQKDTPAEHEVVSTVRKFLKAIDSGDYDRAVELGIPNEFNTREGLVKINEAFEFDKAEIIEAYVGYENAAVLTNSIPAPTGTVQFGYSLAKSNNRWLIRDVDMLPSDEAVKKWLAGFEGVEPTAKRVTEKQN